ncbi:uncharacterized protein LOC133340809 isoform X3 [Lethenteron reissneri]|uniref:uncharacterized protein LOC133340809 isoform X3 n=1 Tax=Lethenteron reissneri TaxID=7753 RepID=UPI002AB61356|nr:uncharacterized protein LOC133340809 isoform X3 [Lethenteron reissneri]
MGLTDSRWLQTPPAVPTRRVLAARLSARCCERPSRASSSTEADLDTAGTAHRQVHSAPHPPTSLDPSPATTVTSTQTPRLSSCTIPIKRRFYIRMACAMATPVLEPSRDFPAWLEAQGVNEEVARAMDSELGIRDYGVLRACIGDGLVRAELLSTARDRLPFGFYAVLRQVVKALQGAELHNAGTSPWDAAPSPGDVTLGGLVDVLLTLFSGLSRELLVCAQRLGDFDGAGASAGRSISDSKEIIFEEKAMDDADDQDVDENDGHTRASSEAGDCSPNPSLHMIKTEASCADGDHQSPTSDQRDSSPSQTPPRIERDACGEAERGGGGVEPRGGVPHRGCHRGTVAPAPSHRGAPARSPAEQVPLLGPFLPSSHAWAEPGGRFQDPRLPLRGWDTRGRRLVPPENVGHGAPVRGHRLCTRVSLQWRQEPPPRRESRLVLAHAGPGYGAHGQCHPHRALRLSGGGRQCHGGCIRRSALGAARCVKERIHPKVPLTQWQNLVTISPSQSHLYLHVFLAFTPEVAIFFLFLCCGNRLNHLVKSPANIKVALHLDKEKGPYTAVTFPCGS